MDTACQALQFVSTVHCEQHKLSTISKSTAILPAQK